MATARLYQGKPDLESMDLQRVMHRSYDENMLQKAELGRIAPTSDHAVLGNQAFIRPSVDNEQQDRPDKPRAPQILQPL